MKAPKAVVKANTDWGMHFQNADRLSENCKLADELSIDVFGGRNGGDIKIAEYLGALNTIKNLIIVYIPDENANKMNQCFVNAINFTRSDDKSKFSQKPPFFDKELKGDKKQIISPTGDHSLLPFLYKTHQELSIIMHEAGLGFKKTMKVTKQQILAKLGGL